MVLNVKKSNEDKMNKNYIQYLLKIDNLKYLRDKKLITDNEYRNAKMRFRKSHIGK